MSNANTIIDSYITALETAGYTISDYDLDVLKDPACSFTDKLVFIKVGYGTDIEQSGGNIQVPMTITFVVCFEIPSAVGSRSDAYIDIITDSVESFKDILRKQNVLNHSLITGSNSLPQDNMTNFIFVEVNISIEYCHYFKG